MINRRLTTSMIALIASSGCVAHRGQAPVPPPPPAPVSAVSDRVSGFEAQSRHLTETVSADRQALDDLQSQREQLSHGYYDQVSTIKAHLQAGTTPGNPELMANWQQAQSALTALDDSVTKLSDLGAKLSADSADATYLVNSVRAAFQLQGALESDHAALAGIQSEASSNAVVLDRLLADVADDVNRQTDALTKEHHDLPGLLREVEAGQLGGTTELASSGDTENEPVEPAPRPSAVHRASASVSAGATPHDHKPLLVVGSGQSPAEYEPTLYKLAAAAIKREPEIAMEVVGVLPSGGPPTSRAVATETVRRKAEAVARALVSYGIPRERISISAKQGAEQMGGEVWIYTD